MNIIETSTPKADCETPVMLENSFTRFQFPPVILNITDITTKNSQKKIPPRNRRSFTPTKNLHYLEDIEISPIELNEHQNKFHIMKITTIDNNNKIHNNSNLENFTNQTNCLMPPPMMNIVKKFKSPVSSDHEKSSIDDSRNSSISDGQSIYNDLSEISSNISGSFLNKRLSISLIMRNYGLGDYLPHFSHLKMLEFINLNNEKLKEIGINDSKEQDKILKVTQIFKNN